MRGAPPDHGPGREMSVDRFILEHWRCPDCRRPALQVGQTRVSCRACGAEFPISSGAPVLIRHDNAVFPVESYLGAPRTRPRPRLARLIPSPSVNIAARTMLKRFAALLDAEGGGHILVVGSGHQPETLGEALASCASVKTIRLDVDRRADVDLFCDAHEICFEDCSFRGIVATAVLEHVLYPERVVEELVRVLAPGGLIYSEIPFMQQVHEGAYDFTRYTLSGHRRLLNRFDEVASGVVAGPGTAFVWAAESLSGRARPVAVACGVPSRGGENRLGVGEVPRLRHGRVGVRNRWCVLHVLSRKEARNGVCGRCRYRQPVRWAAVGPSRLSRASWKRALRIVRIRGERGNPESCAAPAHVEGRYRCFFETRVGTTDPNRRPRPRIPSWGLVNDGKAELASSTVQGR